MQQRRLNDFRRFQHIAATTLVIAAPILIVLPPRKLDFYTFGLAGSFIISANHLVYEKTGLPILENIGKKKREKELKEAQEKVKEEGKVVMTPAEVEKESWKLKRMREEQEMKESGKTYQEMITEQVGDVWSALKGEKKSDEEEK